MTGERSSRRAFTLVELLVVVGIVAVLISLLLPVLGRARERAKSVQCLSNLKQLGVAVALYQNDNGGFLPVHSNWGDLVGKKGALTFYDRAGTSGFAGDSGISSKRPLNLYLQAPDVCRCPSDMGDSYAGDGPETCFENYGTSYLVQWEYDIFMIAHVSAQGAPGSSPLRMSKGGGDMTRKIILGDWNWHANRALLSPRTMWHHPAREGQPRRENMLFGDGHAEDFAFPIAYENASSYYLPPNCPQNGFW